MVVTHQRNYQKLAAMGMENRWEIHHGKLREKPSMTYRHEDVSFYLGHQLALQLDPTRYRVRVNGGRVRRADVTFYIPDVFVFPTSMIGPDKDRFDVLEIYDAPVPLVVEVWSPSTGGYDIDAKIPEYRLRGDLEIWRLHPFEKSSTAWRRQPNGSYAESRFQGGKVQPVALPNVTIDLDALFE